ncbi:MAG TPA: MFS transporter [Candidatus Bathyarchaeia archaeon]|nr:MFS transporter [Candidatus Bathyarchaeia archaeon]
MHRSRYTHETLVLLIVAAGFFLVAYDAEALVLAIPNIGREFHASTSTLANILLAYVLVSAVTLIPFGRLADLFGRKRLFVTGAVIMALSSVFLFVTPSLTSLVILRVFQGIGASLLLGTGVALLSSVFPRGDSGTSIGVSTAAYALGAIAGPLIGGVLTHIVGWRSIFVINIPICIAIAVLGLWGMTDDWADARGERFDVVGCVLFGVTLLATVLGIGSFATRAEALSLWIVGAGGLIAFLAWEARHPEPLLDMSLFERNRAFICALLAVLFYQSAAYGVDFLVSVHLQTVAGLNAFEAGVILGTIPAITVIFSPLAGKFSDRIEPRLLASAGLGAVTVGLLFFSTLSLSTAVAYAALYLLILSVGAALFVAPNTNAAMFTIDRRLYGVGSSTLVTMRLIGQTLSVTLIGAVSVIYVAEVELKPENFTQLLSSSDTAFLLFAALCSIGVACSLARGKLHNNRVDLGSPYGD